MTTTQLTTDNTMFQEIKRLVQDGGNLITRICIVGGTFKVEQIDRVWKRVEEDMACSLEEAEAMFADWTAE